MLRITPVRLETSGGVLSTVDMVVQRRVGPRRLREHDDDEWASEWVTAWICIANNH